MGKRTRVVIATLMLVLGGSVMSLGFIGGGTLQAAAIAETGFNWTRALIWGGAGGLLISAFMFLSASAE